MSSESTSATDAQEPRPTLPAAVHRPVLVDEVVAWLSPREGVMLVDGTAGAGGHTRALAQRVGTSGRVIGLDRDPAMLAMAAVATRGMPVTLINVPYSEMRAVLTELGLDAVDGVVLDLGLSSDQLAWSHRGFSFTHDGPLDMRFDPDSGVPSAADLVNTLDEEELARILYVHGEERHSRRIARRIVAERRIAKFTTTAQLAAVVRRAIPGKWGAIDPATRTFQGLRIAVNDELDHLDAILNGLPDVLKPGGRAVVISFHSLEDRRVKHTFRDDPRLHVLTRKPVTATPEELATNPRARSAKLRVAERCQTSQQPTTNSPPSPTRGKAR